jgi:hypothetical protein
MTDSIKLCLDLRGMPRSARRQVEVHHAQTKNKRNEKVGKRYPKPITMTSPMSGTGVRLETYWDGEGSRFLQSQIAADMNIPNAITGHNCEHGTSVFAAGVAGLELLKYWMVRDGVPSSAVDMLSTHDATFNGATVTYLLDCKTEGLARRNLQFLNAAARILDRKVTGNDSTNQTFYIRRNGYMVVVYYKTDFSHCVFPNDEVAEALKGRARCIIRIEVRMQGHFLRARGWDELESWRHAYSEGRYEAIFGALVRGLFKLDVVLRHKAPRAEAMDRLTATGRAIVEAYLAGTSADALPSIKAGGTADARSKIKSKWRAAILKALRIDITIPWKHHQELHHADVDRRLQYPGDHHPSAPAAAHCFWEKSWSTQLGRLKTHYQSEAARQAAM